MKNHFHDLKVHLIIHLISKWIILYDFFYKKCPKRTKLSRHRVDWCLPRAGRSRLKEMGSELLMGMGFLLVNEEILEVDCSDASLTQ